MKSRLTWCRAWLAPCLAIAAILLGPSVASATPLIGLTLDNKLVYFDSDAPGTIIRTVQIVGLRQGEVLHGIDFREVGGSSGGIGDLYGVGSSGRLYHIFENGQAVAINTTPFNPPLNGNYFGIDFNPTVNVLRVVSQKDQNVRINPDSAVVTLDTPLAYAAGDPNHGVDPNVSAIAYTHNFTSTPKTTLYGIDHGLNVLVRIGGVNGSPPSPNSGVLTTIGPLGVAAGIFNGFDIVEGSNTAYAVFRGAGGISRLYTINLGTGHATLVGTVTGASLRGLASPTLKFAVGYALTPDNHLLTFRVSRPGQILREIVITGLQPGETVLAIDSDYLLGSTGRLYRIDFVDGTATQVGSGTFSVPLNGTSFGFDFNSLADHIRVVSDAEQNLRLNPHDGTVDGVDTPLAYAPGDVHAGANPNVVGAAYTHTTTTTLYGIDTNLDILVRQGGVDGNPSPNSGLLTTIGSLGINATSTVGFDIVSRGSGLGEFAVAALTGSGGVSRLYFINLATGKATQIGVIGGNKLVTGFTFRFVEP